MLTLKSKLPQHVSGDTRPTCPLLHYDKWEHSRRDPRPAHGVSSKGRKAAVYPARPHTHEETAPGGEATCQIGSSYPGAPGLTRRQRSPLR